MLAERLFGNLRSTYNEYPRQFWILVGGAFIDRLGGTVLGPFLTLYVTQRFDVGMLEIGALYGINSVLNAVGSTLGGALTDRLGRKGMMIYGLLISGFANLAIGFADTFQMVALIMLFVGLVGNLGGPAQGAMVADLLPEEKRASGFGVFRVVINMSWVAGPIIGGFLAGYSYTALFICDAVASTITALIVLLAIRETRPEPKEGEAEQSMGQTFAGYLQVLKDFTFVLFIGACILMTLPYLQLYITLGVYLRDTHGLIEQAYGWLMSINAFSVVLFQFAITRRVEKRRPMMMMALGTLLYAIGFGMYGAVSSFIPFVVAMLIITFGEMIVMPISQALVAKLAPADMRGRYMAVFGFAWMIPAAVGPFLAGLIMDKFDPRWVWYGAGLVGLIAAGAFVLLQRRVGEMEQEEQLTEAVAPA